VNRNFITNSFSVLMMCIFYNSAITLNEAPQDSFYCLSSFICSKIKCIDNMGIGQLQTK